MTAQAVVFMLAGLILFASGMFILLIAWWQWLRTVLG